MVKEKAGRTGLPEATTAAICCYSGAAGSLDLVSVLGGWGRGGGGLNIWGGRPSRFGRFYETIRMTEGACVCGYQFATTIFSNFSYKP